jgi:hypothetical protein
MSSIVLEINLDYGLCELETGNCDGEEMKLTVHFDYEPGTDYAINSASTQPNDEDELNLCCVRDDCGNIVLPPKFMEDKIEKLGMAYIKKLKGQGKSKAARGF